MSLRLAMNHSPQSQWHKNLVIQRGLLCSHQNGWLWKWPHVKPQWKKDIWPCHSLHGWWPAHGSPCWIPFLHKLHGWGGWIPACIGIANGLESPCHLWIEEWNEAQEGCPCWLGIERSFENALVLSWDYPQLVSWEKVAGEHFFHWLLILAKYSIPTRTSESDKEHQNSDTDIICHMAPLEYLFMAGKAQEVQVRDVDIRSGWETSMANCLRVIVTEVEGSAIQAHVAKPWWASVESHIVNEAGNLHHCFMTYLGPYWLALDKVRMLWLWLARNWPIRHSLHNPQLISWHSV